MQSFSIILIIISEIRNHIVFLSLCKISEIVSLKRSTSSKRFETKKFGNSAFFSAFIVFHG